MLGQSPQVKEPGLESATVLSHHSLLEGHVVKLEFWFSDITVVFKRVPSPLEMENLELSLNFLLNADTHIEG